MEKMSIFLLKKQPEVAIGEQKNLLAGLTPKPLELFALVVRRVLLERPIDTEALRKAFGGEPDLINRYMSDIYKVLFPNELALRSKQSLQQCIEQADIDVKRFDALTKSLISSVQAEQAEAILEEGVHLYAKGLLWGINQSWAEEFQGYYRKKYHTLWENVATILRSAKNQKEISEMVDKALEYHPDPASETHQYLEKVRAESQYLRQKIGVL